MKNDRQIALEILMEIEEQGAYSNIAINKYLKHYKIEEGAFIRELVYGVIENKIYLDYILKRLIKSGFNKLEKEIKLILQMGIYQIKFLSKTPDYAVINESVKLAKKYSYRLSGFVNGVLRNYTRTSMNIDLPDKEKDLVEYLSVKYSFEQWMIEKLLNQYDEGFTESLLESLNTTPAMVVRVNTLKTDKNSLVEELTPIGIEAKPSMYARDGLLLKGKNIIHNDWFEKGFYQVQDESSMIAIQELDPKPGEIIMDVCAAPGGKTLYMAELMKNQGSIVAKDIYDHKIRLLMNRAALHDITIIKAEVFDSTKFDLSMEGKADKVLVDAPCSGLGVIRRKPEIKYNRKKEDISQFANLQYNILCQGSKYVRPGGILMYTTCTLLIEENDAIISKFLTQNNNFDVEYMNMKQENNALFADRKIDKESIKKKRIQGSIQLYPNIHNTDGFFICKMKRRN